MRRRAARSRSRRPIRSWSGSARANRQRLRPGGAELREAGPGSGIFKSTDGGERWTRLANGIPREPLSKITLAAAQNTPGLVYAYILSGEPRRGFGGGRTSDAGGV